MAKAPVGAWKQKRCLASQIEGNIGHDQLPQDEQFIDGGLGGSKSEAMRSLHARSEAQPSIAMTDTVALDYHNMQRHSTC